MKSAQRKASTSLLLALVWLLAACGPSTRPASPESTAATAAGTTWIESRDVRIPITLEHPAPHLAPYPLVALLHGHGGTRHEAGGFTQVARGLAASGIASVRVDFSGCGESKEDFNLNNISNMLDDSQASIKYAQARLPIDSTRLGLLGFSMGGRLAILLAEQRKDIRALALWAPSAQQGKGIMEKYLGGADTYAAMKRQAAAEGHAPFTTFWGQEQRLGLRWFTDLEASRPASALAAYPGALFVLYGDRDQVIPPEHARAALEGATAARRRVEQVVPGADHGLGLFNDDAASVELTVRSTVAFLREELRPETAPAPTPGAASAR